jgi:hypothetical protein
MDDITSWFFILGISILISWGFSFYSTGSKWDKWVTFFIWLIIFITVYISWYSIIYFLDFSWSNPFVLFFFCIQFFFFTMLIVSRYTKMNIITVISWALGLSTIIITVFTINMWGTLSLCELEVSQPGLQDPFWLTTSIYIGWLVVIGSLFFASETKEKSNIWYLFLSLGIGLSIWLAGYSLKRCESAEKKIKSITGNTNKPSKSDELQAEKIAKYDEVNWIGTSIHLLILMSYFSFFIGQFYASAWYAFMGYYILDKCSPPGDSRRIAIGAVLIILLPIAFLLNGVGGIFS